MNAYRLSARAERDLSGIYSYTFEQWGREQADSYVGRILDCCENLGRYNALLRPVPGRSGRFLRRIGAHVLVVRPLTDGFHILAILHQSMNLEGRMDDIQDD